MRPQSSAEELPRCSITGRRQRSSATWWFTEYGRKHTRSTLEEFAGFVRPLACADPERVGPGMSELLRSPFRYPGSKAGLVDYAATLINESLLTGCNFCETHAGGASLGLGLLGRGIISKLTLVERDPLIYAFWKAVIARNEELCEKIRGLEVSSKLGGAFNPIDKRSTPRPRTNRACWCRASSIGPNPSGVSSARSEA